MKFFKKLFPIIIILTLSYWSVKPLLSTGFYPMHDDTQVARVFEMHKSLTDLVFPVRWVSDLGYGYGYPIFNFYAPLAYYVGAAFMLIGFNALIATKLMIGMGTLLAGVFMYLLGREFWGKTGGIVSSLLYVYAPYHALNIFVRGAIAELWAYAFIPLVFFGIYKIFRELERFIELSTKSKPKTQNAKLQAKVKNSFWLWVCVSAVSYACIVLSHNLTAMMVTPFIFAFSIFLYIKSRIQERIYKPYFILVGLLIGILLSSFYWLPVVFEMKHTNVISVVGGGSDYKDHFVCISQLWNSPWGYGGSGPGCVDGMAFKVGKLHIILSLISLASLLFVFKKDKNLFQTSVLLALFMFASIFLLLEKSRFIWDLLPQMAFFQFPWRFLILVSFFSSLLAGAIFWTIDQALNKKYLSFLITALVSIMIIYVNSEVFVPQRTDNMKSEDLTKFETISWETSVLSDEYLPPGFSKPRQESDVPRVRVTKNQNVSVSDYTENTKQISFKTQAKKQVDLKINLAYFPAWHVFIDHKQVWFKHFNKGILVTIPEGEHQIDIKFSQTPIQIAGNITSLTGVIILVAGIIIQRKK